MREPPFYPVDYLSTKKLANSDCSLWSQAPSRAFLFCEASIFEPLKMNAGVAYPCRRLSVYSREGGGKCVSIRWYGNLVLAVHECHERAIGAMPAQ